MHICEGKVIIPYSDQLGTEILIPLNIISKFWLLSDCTSFCLLVQSMFIHFKPPTHLYALWQHRSLHVHRQSLNLYRHFKDLQYVQCIFRDQYRITTSPPLMHCKYDLFCSNTSNNHDLWTCLLLSTVFTAPITNHNLTHISLTPAGLYLI